MHQGGPHDPGACSDISKAFIKGASTYLPNAELSFDRFHIVQLANKAKAVDEGRWNRSKRRYVKFSLPC
ncbi:transposase [endosymbiont of Riftia pachyptila]|uniref:transposase n=1 Tax=Candidatus Endoriftia persephonae TaxID=393765 RepID=UPI0009D76D1C